MNRFLSVRIFLVPGLVRSAVAAFELRHPDPDPELATCGQSEALAATFARGDRLRSPRKSS
jgi:hypothetical protein